MRERGPAADKLDRIFELQARFDEEVARRRSLDFDFPTWMQKEILAMLSELAELLDELPFKWWKNPREVDLGRVREELVDLLHFLISASLKAGLDADSLYALYVEKNRENHDRQAGRSAKQGYAAPGPGSGGAAG